MNLDLTFANVEGISGDDFLELVVRFNKFEPTVKTAMINTKLVPQKNSDSKTESTVKTGAAVIGAATAGASILQIIFVGSLAQVWGMINGL